MIIKNSSCDSAGTETGLGMWQNSGYNLILKVPIINRHAIKTPSPGRSHPREELYQFR